MLHSADSAFVHAAFSCHNPGMPDDLTLRKTAIGGETRPGDFVVIWDELPIGRIFRSIAVGGGEAWSWTCFLPNVPQPATHRGIASTLPAAKTAFRAAWTDLQSNLSYDQIRKARKLAADPSRPWHT